MSFQDLDEFFDPTLHLPIKGKTYKVPSPDAKTGLWVQGMITAAAEMKNIGGVTEGTYQSLVLDDDEERDTHERVLGSAYDEMVADDVPWHWIRHAGTTALLWIVHGKSTAERYWNAGGDSPKAPTAPTPPTTGSKSTENEAPPV